MRIVRIDPSAVLKVPDTDCRSGLVDAIYRGRKLRVFIQDLYERGERVETERE